MKNIKKIAGNILLYLYTRKRKKGFEDDIQIQFEHAHGDKIVSFIPKNGNKLEKDLFNISDKQAPNLYNALQYLDETGFVFCKTSLSTGGTIFYNLHITAIGIDIVEGVDNTEESRNEFNMTFNINLAENINLESLIKTELDSIVKLALI